MSRYLLLVLPLTLCAKPLAYRSISVPENPQDLSASVKTYLPMNVKGMRLLNAQKQPVPLTVISRIGSGTELLFNPGKEREFTLELHDTAVNNTPAVQRSGVLHFYKRYHGKTVDRLEQFRNFWKNAGGPVRTEWVPYVYTGINRLGPTLNSLNIYRGFFSIDKAQKITFHTASTDASFLLIDGKPVAVWPGRHGVYPGLYGDYKGTVQLQPGRHTLEYLHANGQWTYYAIAAFSRPGDKKMSVMKNHFYLPLLNVKTGVLKDQDGIKLPDHCWKLTGVIDIDGRQMSEFTIDGRDKVCFFREQDVFELDGFLLKNCYHFNAPFIPNNKAVEMIGNYLNRMENQPLPPEGARFLASAIPLFKDRKAAMIFYDHICREGQNLPKEAVFKFYRSMILEPRMEKEQYELAEKELLPMLENNGNEALLELANLYCYAFGDVQKASERFKRIRPEELSAEDLKTYKILQADLALFEKGFDAAMELYGKMESRTKSMSARQIVESEGVLISLRNALITKRYADAMQYLEQIEKARPEIRINPEMVYLKARFYAGLKRPRYAANLCKALLRMHPAARTAAGALYQLYDFEMQRGNKDAALVWAKQLQQEFPNSREAAQIKLK